MLSPADKSELIRLVDSERPLPEAWRAKLFPASGKTVEIGKEYRLEYEGKMKREQVLAETPAAPWQLVRRFNTERPHPDGWRNLLVWGDNLSALRELLNDQRGPNRLGTRDRIKLIYIDPPFATKQDFMKDKEKAYRDKVIGSQFIEFIRRRLIRRMPWDEYRPFVMTLFNVRDHPHERYGFHLDGYVGTHSALVWNFPEHPKLKLDYGFVENLHGVLRGRTGEKFYVIAPVVAMEFADGWRSSLMQELISSDPEV